MSANNVNLTARVSLAPVLKEFANGNKICTIGVAWNNRFFSKEKDDWVSIPNFFEVVVQRDDLVTKIMKHVEVGDLLTITGQLRYRDWDDKETGKKRSSVHIMGFDVMRCELFPAEEKKEPVGASNGGNDDVEF